MGYGYLSTPMQAGGVSVNLADYTATRNGSLPQFFSAAYLYENLATFNEPVVVGNMVNRCDYMLYNCQNFNSPITIGENVTRLDNALMFCYNYNQNIFIPKNVTSLYSCFFKCYKLKNVVIEDGSNLYSAGRIFYGCNSLENIDFSMVRKMAGSEAMSYCSNLRSINMPQSIISGSAFFRNCVNLNQSFNVNIVADSVGSANVGNMFNNCYSLNSPVNLNFINLNSVLYLSSCFAGCSNLNAPINITGISDISRLNRVNTDYMFNNCVNYNQPFSLSLSCDNFNGMYMFSNCIKYNQPFSLSLSCDNFLGMYMFNACEALNQNIELTINNVSNLNVSRLLYGANRNCNLNVNIDSGTSNLVRFQCADVIPLDSSAVGDIRFNIQVNNTENSNIFNINPPSVTSKNLYFNFTCNNIFNSVFLNTGKNFTRVNVNIAVSNIREWLYVCFNSSNLYGNIDLEFVETPSGQTPPFGTVTKNWYVNLNMTFRESISGLSSLITAGQGNEFFYGTANVYDYYGLAATIICDLVGVTSEKTVYNRINYFIKPSFTTRNNYLYNFSNRQWFLPTYQTNSICRWNTLYNIYIYNNLQ